MTEYFDKEMRQRVKDIQSMLDWNESVTLNRHGIAPLLDLVIEALDAHRRPTLIIEDGWLVQKRPDGTAIRICLMPDPEEHPEMFPDEPDDADDPVDPVGLVNAWLQPAIRSSTEAPEIAACVPDDAGRDVDQEEEDEDEDEDDDEVALDPDPSLCNADITDRSNEHQMSFCQREEDHAGPHRDLRTGVSWTDATHH